ncbi:MAG: hypothetical protein AAGI17_02415 [Planctomycetota bacterium]
MCTECGHVHGSRRELRRVRRRWGVVVIAGVMLVGSWLGDRRWQIKTSGFESLVPDAVYLIAVHPAWYVEVGRSEGADQTRWKWLEERVDTAIRRAPRWQRQAWWARLERSWQADPDAENRSFIRIDDFLESYIARARASWPPLEPPPIKDDATSPFDFVEYPNARDPNWLWLLAFSEGESGSQADAMQQFLEELADVIFANISSDDWWDMGGETADLRAVPHRFIYDGPETIKGNIIDFLDWLSSAPPRPSMFEDGFRAVQWNGADRLFVFDASTVAVSPSVWTWRQHTTQVTEAIWTGFRSDDWVVNGGLRLSTTTLGPLIIIRLRPPTGNGEPDAVYPFRQQYDEAFDLIDFLSNLQRRGVETE